MLFVLIMERAHVTSIIIHWLMSSQYTISPFCKLVCGVNVYDKNLEVVCYENVMVISKSDVVSRDKVGQRS